MTAFPPLDAGKREWLQAIRTLAHSVRKVEANGAKGMLWLLWGMSKLITLQRTKISHEKKKIIFKSAFRWDMLVTWRVAAFSFFCCYDHENTYLLYTYSY